MASTNRRAAPARSRRSAPRGSKRRTAPKQNRKLFDYPRTGFHGLHRWLPSWRVVLGTMLGFAFLVAGSTVAAYAVTKVPSASADDVKAQTTTVYFAPHDDGTPGAVMGTFATQKRKVVDYATLPKYVGQATAAAEDKSFYSSSSGISIKGMGRALINNLKGGKTEGGSTLTQQYVERYYVGQTTTDYVGKAKEAFLAIKIAKTQSKDEIMGRYLNAIYYGRDSYGIQAAAQAYFGVDASALTVEQSALLAGIIPSPNNWDPRVSPKKAEARWNVVLDSMVDSGWLTGAARDAMVFPQTIPYVESNTMGGTNGYLLAMVRDEMLKDYGVQEGDLKQAGYSIVTTIKEDMQASAVAQASGFMSGTLEGEKAQPNPLTRASITSVDPTSGAILALYGGPDFLGTGPQDQLNRATVDHPEAGSTVKPFALIAALEKGIPLTTKFNGNAPQKIKGWDPVPSKSVVTNFAGEEHEGTVDLVKATADSVNTVFAQLNLQVTPQATQEVADRAGVPDIGVNNSNVLGYASVHPIDMIGAYATIASGGILRTPYIVAQVKDWKGNVAYEHQVQSKRVFAADVIADTTYAMQQVVQSGSAKPWIKPLARPIAGKTGTSTDNKSAWFIGFTPKVVTAVSLSQISADLKGEDTISPLGTGKNKGQVSGGKWPSFIWQSYMKTVFAMPAYAAVEDFPPRANVAAEKKPTAAPKPSETVAPPAPTAQAPQQIAVPAGLEGKLEADATAAVVNAGLAPNIISEPSDTVTSGRIIRIDPAGGTMLAPNGTVTLVVSTGPKAAPTPAPTATTPVPASP
ncbi:transglycosylase domain-containing protein [Cellulomonas sp. McL0617]|uniref:transglycosylase domain-containing protein n=1 Tax=Cellulomonas sp. McL0617 TaxID=3415675 RepID=UPI003CEC3663